MALDESALPELLDALRAGDGVNLIRDAVRLVMQELIELEAAEAIGAGRYERTEARINERNGHRPRLLATQAGDIELKIPKLSQGSFFPSLLSPRRRIDQALHAVIMQAYVEGVSTRSVDDLVQALGIDSGISKSQVSRICAKLDVEVDAFRNRSLAHIEFPYVYLDATYVKARDTDLHPPRRRRPRRATRRMGRRPPLPRTRRPRPLPHRPDHHPGAHHREGGPDTRGTHCLECSHRITRWPLHPPRPWT